MKLDKMLPFFNVKDTPVDGSFAQRASHWKQTNDGVIHDANGSMRATPMVTGAGLPVTSQTNIDNLKSAMQSVKSEIVTLFSKFQPSESGASQLADKFITGVVEKASQSAHFEVSLSYAMSRFTSDGSNSDAWTDVKGLNITVDNVSGEFQLDFSQVKVDLNTKSSLVVKDVAMTTRKEIATQEESNNHNPLAKMNESSLRELHAFLLTANGIDGSEIGQATERAILQGKMPNSDDRETYIAQWKELQKDPSFRHDITYDDRDTLQNKVEDLLREYQELNSTGEENAIADGASQNVAANNLPLSNVGKRVQSTLDVMINNDFFTAIQGVNSRAEKVTFNVDMSVFLGVMQMEKSNQLTIGMENRTHLAFNIVQPKLDVLV